MSPAKAQDTVIKCDQCGKTFQKLSSKRQHKRRKHPELVKKRKTNEKGTKAGVQYPEPSSNPIGAESRDEHKPVRKREHVLDAYKKHLNELIMSLEEPENHGIPEQHIESKMDFFVGMAAMTKALTTTLQDSGKQLKEKNDEVQRLTTELGLKNAEILRLKSKLKEFEGSDDNDAEEHHEEENSLE